MSRISKSLGFVAGLAAVVVMLAGGCTNTFVLNQVEELSGDVSIIIINNTPYRASFTLGGYNAMLLDSPVAPELDQERLEAMTSTSAISLSCARNIAIGTAELVELVIETEGNLESDFDDDAFSEYVNFSAAPIDEEGAALPTEGTAEGIEVLLGVDYACGDQLIFTFEQDETASGGFSIGYQVLQTGTDD